MGKKRCRKAQMAAFVMIGIILLIGAGALTYIMYIAKKAPADRYVLEQLPESLDKTSLDVLMTSCVKKVSEPFLVKIAKYGGTIDPKPNEFKLYNHTYFRYLCEQKPGYSKCVNRLITRQSMQEELQEKITAEMRLCIAPAIKFYGDRGYDIKSSEVSTRVVIGVDDVNVIVAYPLLITKGTTKISVTDYSEKFNYPLGKLYDLAMDIMNSENSRGYFNQEDWMYNHGIEILIQKHRPYPDIVYRISKIDWVKNQPYIFNFALQGYDRLPELAGVGSLGGTGASSTTAARSTAYDQDLGCCYNKNDGNCFENGNKNSCGDSSLEWRRGNCGQSGFKCMPISENRFDNRTGLCYGADCFHCLNSTYADGDNVNDPTTYTGPSKLNGESWCMYEGPAGQGLDAVGSRHYKHLCVDGLVLVEECRDYRDEMCVEEKVDVGGKKLTRAVCRPNRWQDCHLISEETDCKDTSKRDCYWNTMQSSFVFGSPKDEDSGSSTAYEKRYCVPQVPPGLKFWNTLDGMQVCGWANNYYECPSGGCDQEWADFDAAFCLMQGDCGIYRNYLGKLPTLSLSNMFPGAGQMPFMGSSASGGGFVSMPNEISTALLEYNLPSQENFLISAHQKMDGLPTYPAERAQKQVTPEMFIHNSPNDYSLTGIMTFIQEYMDWATDRVGNIDSEIWDLIVHEKKISWNMFGISMCNVWMPSTSGEDCGLCNNNPYRPCTEYKCRSLGMYCSYEEEGGVGKCSSYSTSTVGKPVVQFDGQVTPGYTVKGATLSSTGSVYVGKEVNEPLGTDYTFQVKTNRETQCMLTLVPGASFGLNPPFPGTATDYTFKTKHNLTIPYMSTKSLSVMLLPLQMMNMISFDPDQMWSIFQNAVTQIIDYIDGTADDCDDCHDFPYEDCDHWQLHFVPSSKCDDMDDMKDQMQSMYTQMTDFWQNTLKPQIEKWMGVAQKNAIDEILMYASQSKYHAFIKCRDRGGNENDVDLDFIRFKVSKKPLPAAAETPDGPPAIAAIEPANWTEAKAEADGKSMVAVFIDQLSECAYSTADKDFIYMENKFECQKSTYADSTGGYMCNASIPFTTLKDTATPIRIRCMDHPEHYETFAFRLEQGTEFSGPAKVEWLDPSGEGQPGTVIVKDPARINATKEKITVPTTSVKFFMEFKRNENDHEKALECRYATTPEAAGSSSAMFVDAKGGNSECDNCTAMLTATGTDYYVSCHFKTDKRNQGDSYQYVLKEAGAAPAPAEG